MARRIIVLLSLLGASSLASAQEGGDEGGISGKASLGFLATSGNTESTNANTAFNLVWAREVWSHEYNLRAVSATSNEATTAEAYTAAYTARRPFGERGYLFAALDWESDRFSSYDSRLSESVGYGRRFLDTARHVLSAELGAGARELHRIDGTEESEAILRAALDYAWTMSENASFTQQVTVESGSANTSTNSVSELRSRLFGDVALVLSFRIRRNSDVVPGTEETDRFTAVSLEYAF